ncbi:MAG: hypothetical protein AB1Z31_13150, partial [Desulfobacterales bacterium]
TGLSKPSYLPVDFLDAVAGSIWSADGAFIMQALETDPASGMPLFDRNFPLTLAGVSAKSPHGRFYVKDLLENSDCP